MSITEAERKRLSRQRQKEAIKNALRDAAPMGSYLATPFSAFLADCGTLMFEENLDAFGVQIAGKADLTTEVQDFPSQYERSEPLTSLQRAMGMVDAFTDAAQELAHLINVYKLQEVARAIGEAEKASADLPRDDVEALRASFAEIDRLKAIQSDLRRPTRQTFLAIRSKGELPEPTD
ncbi:hypothetical protein [Mesorhizobium marinum]|uniref:hypothetical protein n=1 Tax=Mesorhizobium marinum TaxID=3228790 RepID=UPI003465064D